MRFHRLLDTSDLGPVGGSVETDDVDPSGGNRDRDDLTERHRQRTLGQRLIAELSFSVDHELLWRVIADPSDDDYMRRVVLDCHQFTAAGDLLDWSNRQVRVRAGDPKAIELQVVPPRENRIHLVSDLVVMSVMGRPRIEVEHPTKAVQEHLHISKSSAAKKVARCLELGLLPRTTPGKASA